MYVELHCHSAFSLLDGASLPEVLAVRAVELGYPALALTDHDELGGIVAFSQAAEALGLEAIVGAEISVDGIRDSGSGLRELPQTRELGSPSAQATGAPRDALSPRRTPPNPESRTPNTDASHLVLLAENRTGYGNLSTLITRARMDHPRGEPRVSLDLLAQHAEGLFALTGCLRGWVPSLLAQGDENAACEAAATLVDIFDRRVAIECWDHSLAEERQVVPGLIAIARALDIPWVVTNDVHYARPEGRVVHDVLCALRHERTLDEMGTRLRPNGEWHLKSPAQMRRRWQHAPEGIRATLDVAERCRFRIRDLEPKLPRFPLPPGVTDDDYLAALVHQGAEERWGSARNAEHDRQLEHELALIRRLGLAGYFLIVWDIVRFARREGILCQGRGSAANSAVCFCLGITAIDPIRMGFLFERFLSEERKEAPDIDLDFSHREREKVIQYVYRRYGREHAAMVCEQITYRGRSAVRDAARVLGFSLDQANALAGLSDRFSARATAEAMKGGGQWPVAGGQGKAGPNPDAADPVPEFLGSQMVQGTEATTRASEEKERARHVARPTSSSQRPKPNAAYEPYGSPSARDSGFGSEVVGFSPDHRPLATGHSPSFTDPHAEPTHNERRNPAMSFRSAEEKSSLLTKAGLDVNDRRVQVLPMIVHGLHQIPRHRSIHVGGFVLTKEPLRTVVPIEPASMPERTVIQWEKDDLDPVGLVKIDLLGLGMLTLLQDCLKYIRETRGHTIDLAQLDMDDQAVYDDLCRADTIGIFQVESRAQMNTLPRLKPRCFYDLVVEVAIIRPGPIQGDMVHPYLRRRAGEEPVTYPHPSLEPILKRTLGVPLFQEQGMQVAISAAGFSAGEADNLRRAMGHKRSRERMAAICVRLIEGMQRNGIPEATAMKIYQQINAFADYGFPESHAASFALLVYASAYLKHYYAPEFLAAILNAQPMGFYAPGTLIEDAQRHGVEVRPIDVTCSGYESTLESVPGRAAPAVRLGLRLIRGLDGPRTREKLERVLAEGGPFRSIDDLVVRSGLDRGALRSLAEAGALDSLVPDEPHPRRRRAAIWRMLESLRGDAGPLAPTRPRLEIPTPVKPQTAVQITAADYRLTGVSLHGHPMLHLRRFLRPNGVLTAEEVLALPDGSRNVAVAGLVICRQRPGTAKGFVFLTLEDETGMVNVVVTPKRFERQALMISTAPIILVRGMLQVEQTVVNLRGEWFRELKANAGEQWAEGHDFH